MPCERGSFAKQRIHVPILAAVGPTVKETQVLCGIPANSREAIVTFLLHSNRGLIKSPSGGRNSSVCPKSRATLVSNIPQSNTLSLYNLYMITQYYLIITQYNMNYIYISSIIIYIHICIYSYIYISHSVTGLWTLQYLLLVQVEALLMVQRLPPSDL